MNEQIVEHPSSFIGSASADTIRRTAMEAEQLKDLHDDQLRMIFQHAWFKMFVPEELGGNALSVPAVLRIEEGLSYADGSTGWVVTLCSGAAWFAGFIQIPTLRGILAHDKVCFAGSGAIGGTADIHEDGYEVSGLWKYASGSLHATVFTANCLVRKDGNPQQRADGSPLIRTFLFRNDEVVLHRHWNSMGMIATASHSFEVKKLDVSADRSFMIDADSATLRDPVYQYPFLQLAETTLTVNLSGMAMRFLDLCAPLFSERMNRRNAAQGPDLHRKLVQAKAEMNGYRSAFYAAVEKSWRMCEDRQRLPQAVLGDVSKTSHALASSSRQLVNELYPYCGLVAADTRQEINRVWRNIHTAGQHALFTSNDGFGIG